MTFLNSIFGENNQALMLVILFIGLTVALILLFWVWRKITSGSQLRGGRSRQPRLSVTDAAIVDDKRRLVLVRRDNVEHLLMIGGPGDIVIEQNIVRHQASVPQAMAVPEAPVEPQQVGEKPQVAEVPADNGRTSRLASAGAATIAAAGAATGAAAAMGDSVKERASALINGRSNGARAQQPAVEAASDDPMLDDFDVENFDLDGESEVASAEDVASLEAELETELVSAETQSEHTSQTSFVETGREPDFDAMLNEHISSPAANDGRPANGFKGTAPAIDAAPEPVPSPANDMEDEMQKLLNELSVGR